jgi:ADP-heptose:LPS heptosyltransferase
MTGLPGYEPPEALGGFDEIWAWYGSNREEFRAAVAHLPFRFFPALPEMWGEVHATDFFLAHAGAAAGAAPELPGRRRDEGYIAIHPFSGSPKKNWPVGHFMQVAARLRAKGQEAVFVCGPEEGLPGAKRFTDLGALMDFLAGARAYVGNDSGPTHMAAALGVPTLALFGPTNPKVWAPRGRRVRVMDQRSGPRAVFEALYGLIHG